MQFIKINDQSLGGMRKKRSLSHYPGKQKTLHYYYDTRAQTALGFGHLPYFMAESLLNY